MRGGLVLVVTASVQIVDVKAKCQLLVDVDGEVGLEAFFTVHFVAGLVVGKIGVRHVAVGEKHLVGTCEKLEKGAMKMVGSLSSRSKNRRERRGEPKFPK